MNSVIVLTSNYYYWDERPMEEVVSKIFKDKIETVISMDEEDVGGQTFRIPKPMVVRLKEFSGYKSKKDWLPYKDMHVFSRDNNICQYWHYDEMGEPFKYICTQDERTIDHVLPKSHGHGKSFVNCVTCCNDHNSKKANRTPEEAGLKLIKKPFIPRIKKGNKVFMKFSYNPNKISHQYYMEKFLCKDFSHISKD